MKASEKDGIQHPALSTQTSAGETFKRELKELHKSGLIRKPVCLEASRNATIRISGKTYINFSSNDYLGLSNHAQVKKTAITALKKYGVGSGASRLLCGTYTSHQKLEERIARFKKTQAALVFNTGYAANTGIIPAIAGTDTVIFSDELNHASIVDGARLAKAKVVVYRHRDVNHLESLLKKNAKSRRITRGLIITDTIFSMDGDIAPLEDLASLCKKYKILLMTDDAHGTGVLGDRGKGALEHFGIQSDNIIQMGTLSKAVGCYGAFVAGKKDLINVLINKARSFIYSTSLPPAMCEAGMQAIDIIEFRSNMLRQRLWKNTRRLHNGLRDLGFDTLDSETPIIPVLAGDVDKALTIGRYLYKHGIFAPAIRPPTVPEGKCRIRFSVTAGHTDKDIDLVLKGLKNYR